MLEIMYKTRFLHCREREMRRIEREQEIGKKDPSKKCILKFTAFTDFWHLLQSNLSK